MQTYRPIFISIETTAFSGATLLAFLLGNHPDIATIGEISGLIDTDDPETYLCSCGNRIGECEFWQAVEESMQAKGHSFDVSNFNMKFDFGGPYIVQRIRNGSFRMRMLDTLHDEILFRLPGEKQRFAGMTKRNSAFVETILDLTKKRYFLDSSKSRLRVRALRHFGDIDVQIIHLTRRVEGVVYSQLKRLPESDVSVLARDWKRRHQRLLSSYQHWPETSYLHVRYEDVCQKTQESLMQLYRFLGIDHNFQETNIQTTTHHVIGNPMRLIPLHEITLDEHWKQALSPVQLSQIYQVAGKLNRMLGYPDHIDVQR